MDGSSEFQAFLFHPTISGDLESIVVALARQTETTKQTRFNLYEGTDTTIGNLLESYLVPNLFGDPGVLVTMNSITNPALVAGKSYWLSMTEPGAANGSNSMWGFNNQNIHTERIDGSGNIPDAFAPAFKVTVEGSTVPEPASTLLVGLGLVAGIWRRRSRL